ncbi:signal peptidase II [Ichthyenterobacterium magnum]|uniref:Lipoprotein signal peptidase n=1 Tax=Ichthyenterobacterium magnum TaxID=1230530 RepID=A0A420DFN2_9FLAO|nr:signal peptidase II [Ichthyenterobacterium magnum]RKE91916.1 signal peptidase II [Ichthyenterobacterium magnum]
MKISRTAGVILIIVLNIAIDQISKVIVRATIEKGEIISVIGDTFRLMNVENEGAFLGMGSDINPTLRLILLLILPTLVLAYLIYYILKTKALDKLSLIALSCIAGGGIANVYDRIAYGSVTDFLHLDFGGVFRTGIFNVADMSVTFGMIALLLGNFFSKKKKES